MASKIRPGDKFGSWVVIREDEFLRSGRRYWVCMCTCGLCAAITRSVLVDSLRHGKSASCGTVSRLLASEANSRRAIDHAGFVNSDTGVRIVRRDRSRHRQAWVCVCPRCGCEFSGHIYNVTSGRCKGCKECFRHRKGGRSKKAELFGAVLTTAQLAELSGIKPGTIRARIRRGMTAAEAVATRSRKHRHGREAA